MAHFTPENEMEDGRRKMEAKKRREINDRGSLFRFCWDNLAGIL